MILKGAEAGMAKEVWTFTVRDGSHTVELEHGYWSGRAIITVDGEEIERTREIGRGSTHDFQVSGVPCVLEIIETGVRFRYELFVDGKHVYGEKETGKARQIRHMRNGLGPLHIYFKALLYSYLLFFALVFAAVISGVSAGIMGQGSPPEEGVWWFPIIFFLVALLVFGVLYYSTRRKRFWGVYRDVLSSRTKLSGRVSRKWVTVTHGQYTTRQHRIEVDGKSFEIFGRIYEQLWRGDEVIVSYWPHSGTVASVERLNV